MKRVRFVVDEARQETDVIIKLKANPELWEDMYDRCLARKRARVLYAVDDARQLVDVIAWCGRSEKAV